MSDRILVVDDEPEIRSLLTRLLTRQGYAVESASSGESALVQVDTDPPDVILLDVRLPGIDGFEVCRAIKSRPSTCLVPVVLVTGLCDRESRLNGIDAGADEFLNKPFDPPELAARVRSLVRLKRHTDDLESAESVIVSLAQTIEARDPYTNGHCQRLARYAVALGRHLGLADAELKALHRGAYLHDVGKIGIPDALLYKGGGLTHDEYEIVKRHTLIGDDICGAMRSLALVRPIVRHHHERRDGSGYPDGLRGDEIPVLAQIVAIVDIFDAITTTRPYRTARSIEHALHELRREADRGRLRADLLEAFTATVELGLC